MAYPVHNFIAPVRSICNYLGRRLITTLNGNTLVYIPVQITPDTSALFTAIRADANQMEMFANSVTYRYHARALKQVRDYKSFMVGQGNLIATGGNIKVVRAMLYARALKRNVLPQDIGYIWGLLSSEQKQESISEPYQELLPEPVKHQFNAYL